MSLLVLLFPFWICVLLVLLVLVKRYNWRLESMRAALVTDIG